MKMLAWQKNVFKLYLIWLDLILAISESKVFLPKTLLIGQIQQIFLKVIFTADQKYEAFLKKLAIPGLFFVYFHTSNASFTTN